VVVIAIVSVTRVRLSAVSLMWAHTRLSICPWTIAPFGKGPFDFTWPEFVQG
jgi:hypothetical protein